MLNLLSEVLLQPTLLCWKQMGHPNCICHSAFIFYLFSLMMCTDCCQTHLQVLIAFQPGRDKWIRSHSGSRARDTNGAILTVLNFSTWPGVALWQQGRAPWSDHHAGSVLHNKSGSLLLWHFTSILSTHLTTGFFTLNRGLSTTHQVIGGPSGPGPIRRGHWAPSAEFCLSPACAVRFKAWPRSKIARQMEMNWYSTLLHSNCPSVWRAHESTCYLRPEA